MKNLNKYMVELMELGESYALCDNHAQRDCVEIDVPQILELIYQEGHEEGYKLGQNERYN